MYIRIGKNKYADVYCIDSYAYADIIHFIISSHARLQLLDYDSTCKVYGGDVNLHLKFNARSLREGFKSRLNLKDGSSRASRIV